MLLVSQGIGLPPFLIRRASAPLRHHAEKHTDWDAQWSSMTDARAKCPDLSLTWSQVPPPPPALAIDALEQSFWGSIKKTDHTIKTAVMHMRTRIAHVLI